LRIGIGAVNGAVLRDHVLSGFTAGEKKILGEVLGRSAEAIRAWMEEGVEAAMNKFNEKNKETR
jgi:PTH1 family peptidyl-tRNA hydrolase